MSDVAKTESTSADSASTVRNVAITPGNSGLSRHNPSAPLRPWIASGWLAVAVAIGVMYTLSVYEISGATSLITSVTAGWISFIIFAPWLWIRKLNEDRESIRKLVKRLRSIDIDNRQQMLSSVLIDRKDDIGELSRAIQACLGKAVASKAEARMLHRTMRDTIEKRTRNATAKLEKESNSDALTGLGNRRALDEVAREISNLAELNTDGNEKIAIMMIDMDRFKQVNDTLGHEAGDDCLVFLAELLRSTVRKTDSIVRLGGDEFVVIFNSGTIESTLRIADRLASLFVQIPWPHENVPRPTLSIGIADFGLAMPDAFDECLRLADKALYTAKRRGRNTICTCDDLDNSANAAA